MLLSALFSLSADLCLVDVRPEDEGATLMLRSSQTTATCPACAQPSTRVHGHYTRRLADLPCQRRPVRVCLEVRRPSSPGSPALGSTLKVSTSTFSVISSFHMSSWTNCAPGSVVIHTSYGCGWPSTPQRRFFPCSIWARDAKRGSYRDPFPTTDPGPWLAPALHE